MNSDSTGHAPVHSQQTSPGIVAGIGLRHGADVQEILALLDSTLAEIGAGRGDLSALAALDRKCTHPALGQAAVLLGVPLLPLAETDLPRTVPNPSERVRLHIGLSSLAEAAALAFGPLLVEKRRSANVTCALARYYGTSASSTAKASAMLSTSMAGS